jgi:hypothetical protein
MNNLTDISFNPRFYEFCGITQEELERDFADEIAQVSEEKGMQLAKCFAVARKAIFISDSNLKFLNCKNRYN